MTARSYSADVLALLRTLADGARPMDLHFIAADLLARAPKAKPAPIHGPIDTAGMTDSELFAHFKKTAPSRDLTFFRSFAMSTELYDRATAIQTPTAKDLTSLRAAWRTERTETEIREQIPQVGSPAWAEAWTAAELAIEQAAIDAAAIDAAIGEGMAS